MSVAWGQEQTSSGAVGSMACVCTWMGLSSSWVAWSSRVWSCAHTATSRTAPVPAGTPLPAHRFLFPSAAFLFLCPSVEASGELKHWRNYQTPPPHFLSAFLTVLGHSAPQTVTALHLRGRVPPGKAPAMRGAQIRILKLRWWQGGDGTVSCSGLRCPGPGIEQLPVRPGIHFVLPLQEETGWTTRRPNLSQFISFPNLISWSPPGGHCLLASSIYAAQSSLFQPPAVILECSPLPQHTPLTFLMI